MTARTIAGYSEPAGADDFAPGARQTVAPHFQSEAFLQRQGDIVARLPFPDEGAASGVVSNARLAMARAWGRLLAVNLPSATETADEIELLLGGAGWREREMLLPELAIFRGAVLALKDDCYAALPIALAALGARPSPLVTFVAGMLCRLAFWKMGDLPRFYEARQGMWDAKGRRDNDLFAYDRAMEGAVEFQQLRFGVAGKLARRAVVLAERRRYRSASTMLLPTALLAQLRYEEGALAEAEELLCDCLSPLRAHGTVESAIRIYPLFAKIAAHRSQTDFAILLLREGERLGEARGWSRLTALCVQERVELCVREGQIAEAEQCLEQLRSLLSALEGAPDYTRGANRRALVLASFRVATVRGGVASDLVKLRSLHQDAATVGDLYLAQHLALRIVEALSLEGGVEEAVETLIHALEIGASVGLYQLFLDGGTGMVDMLDLVYGRLSREMGRRRYLLPYVSSLIEGGRALAEESGSPKSARMRGCLSSRECSILLLIKRGQSNKRIARTLGIAPETVKSHLKNVFLKLGVQTRAEAVARADSLRIL